MIAFYPLDNRDRSIVRDLHFNYFKIFFFPCNTLFRTISTLIGFNFVFFSIFIEFLKWNKNKGIQQIISPTKPPAADESGGGVESQSADGGSSRERRRAHRRATRHESRYHSEVRQEAVQQVLAAMQNRPKPSMPMPSKRTSVMGPDQVLPQPQPPSSSSSQPVQQQAGKSRGSLDGSSSGSSSEDDDDDDDVDDEDDESLSPSARHQQSVVPSVSVALGGTGSVGTPERVHRFGFLNS